MDDSNYQRIDRFGAALAETARVWRMKLDQRLRPLGLSQAKWRTLLNVARGGEGMAQTTLAERIGVEGPTLVGLLDRLARDGWIERRPCSSDRRIRRVYLTPRAQDALQEIEAVAAQLRKELCGGIPEDDLLRCLRVLGQVCEKAETLE